MVNLCQKTILFKLIVKNIISWLIEDNFYVMFIKILIQVSFRQALFRIRYHKKKSFDLILRTKLLLQSIVVICLVQSFKILNILDYETS